MARTQKIANTLYKVLVKDFKDMKTKHPIILMSGGADSHSVLFAALEAGKKPIAASFHMEGIESRDWKVSVKTCETFNVPLIEVILPNDLLSLQEDLITLATVYGAKKKSEFECSWPMFRAMKHIQRFVLKNKIKHPTIITGHGADTNYVLSKKGMMHFKDNPDAYREPRHKDPTTAQKHILPIMAKDHGLTLLAPWQQVAIQKAFKGATWDECNKPRQKEPTRRAFESYFEQARIYPHTNLQLGDSGIAKHFEILLDSAWNKNGYKSVVGVYNDLNRRLAAQKGNL